MGGFTMHESTTSLGHPLRVIQWGCLTITSFCSADRWEFDFRNLYVVVSFFSVNAWDCSPSSIVASRIKMFKGREDLAVTTPMIWLYAGWQQWRSEYRLVGQAKDVLSPQVVTKQIEGA